jgi:hypothetical protein
MKYLIVCLAGGIISSMFYVRYQKKCEAKLDKNIGSYISYISNSVERKIVENIPIYSDFVRKVNEKKLRKYLFKHHIKIAKKNGVNPLKKSEDVKKFINSGQLKSIDLEEANYYFYGVSRESRYLTPQAAEGLLRLVERYQENLKKRNIEYSVKLAISSVLRTKKYQANLQAKNKNAVNISTHSYGVSFDIFWDDFYVVLPEIVKDDISSTIIKRIRKKMGFVLGDSLRRQFRSILFETLVQMQDEGLLYAILERNQRCYHVTIL